MLVGGGHVNVQVMLSLFETLKPQDRCKVILISEYEFSYYSGMLPGCIAQLYQKEQVRIDLVSLAAYCGIQFIRARVTGLDRAGKLVLTDSAKRKEKQIPYSYLSINIGSRTLGTYSIPGVLENTITTRPISDLLRKLEEFESSHPTWPAPPRVAIIGAGAAGIELCFGMHARYHKKYNGVDVLLVNSKDEFLPELGSWVNNNVTSVLKEKSIKYLSNRKCEQVMQNKLILDNKDVVEFDLCLWCTGPEAHHEIHHNMGLELDENDFILVSSTLVSKTDGNILASGDCASIENCPWVQKAGVYAVREGSTVSNNLVALIRGENLQVYSPQDGFLSLMSTGDEKAISSWKGVSVHGTWVWWTKDSIDQKFVDGFNVAKLKERANKSSWW